MTKNDILAEIGNAAVQRKECLDRISCYERRLKTAMTGLQMLLDPDRDPRHEDNQTLLSLGTDPREDAKGYVEALNEAAEHAEFLRKHNALG